MSRVHLHWTVLAVSVVLTGVVASDAAAAEETRLVEAQKSGMGIEQIRSLLSTKSLAEVNNVIAVKSATVPTIDAVTLPFKPGNNKCVIPKNIADKISGLKNWVPNGLDDALKTIHVENVEYVNQASVNLLLHTIELSQPSKGKLKRALTITSVRSYLSFDPAPFMDTTRPSFLFTLDCSGYLNASMSAAATFLAGDIKEASKTALKSKYTAMVARASIFSPFTAAMRPADVTTAALAYLSVRDNMELLFGLIAQLPADVADTDELLPARQLDLLWTSTSGEATAQGDANLSGGIGAAIGFGSVNAEASSGFSINRRANYRDFTTYVIESPSSASTSTSVAALRERFHTVAKNAKILAPLSNVNGSYVMRFDFPQLMCNQMQWSVTSNITGGAELQGMIAEVEYLPVGGCSLSAVFENTTDLKSQKYFKLKGTNSNMKVNVEYLLKI